MFNNRLKELRLLHNYTMDDLAKIYNERFNGKSIKVLSAAMKMAYKSHYLQWLKILQRFLEFP